MDYQDWRDQKDQWREDKRRWRAERRQAWREGRPGHFGGRGLMGFLFIAFGALFLLSNLGLFYIDDLWSFWPVILIVIGLNSSVRSRSASGWVSSGVMITIGTIFLLHNLGYIHGSVWQYFWPLILILVGLSMLFRRQVFGARPSVSGPSGAISASVIDEWAVFGGVKRRIESQEFEGGEAFAMFGGIEIDLRKAGTKKDEMRIDANAMFGGIDIRVPENWEVVMKGTGIFGGYEDKSHGMPATDGSRPRLVVTGQAVFGGVVVKD